MFSPKYFQSRFWAGRYWAEAGDHDNARFVQISVLTSAIALPAIPERINYVMIQAEGKDVRYRDDGVAPTASIGLILYAGDPPSKFVGGVKALKFIESSASAKLNVRFY